MDDPTYWVYVFAHKGDAGLTGPVKVGISKDVDRRLGETRTYCPHPIDIAYVFECPNKAIARDIEKSFHVTQCTACTHGEWFDFEPVHAIHLLCIAFRAALQHNIDDLEILDASLDCAGVYWAEKRFNLAVPSSVGLQ